MKSHLNSFKKKEENRLIGVNLIPNKGIKDLAPYLCDKDFGFSFKEVCEIADYIVINLSGFNKSGLSHYLEEDHLRNLILSLQRIRTFEFGVSSMFLLEKNKEKLIQRFFSEPLIERKALGDLKRSFPAILIKIDPDLSANKKEKLCEVALETGLDGIIIGEMYNKAEIGCFEFFENEDLKKIENNALSSIYSRTKG